MLIRPRFYAVQSQSPFYHNLKSSQFNIVHVSNKAVHSDLHDIKIHTTKQTKHCAVVAKQEK